MKELHIQKEIVHLVRLRGGYAVSYYGGATVKNLGPVPRRFGVFFCRFIPKDWDRPDGFPDIVGAYRGRPIAIEVKMPGQKAKPHQTRMLGLLKEAGYFVSVCHSIYEAEAFLESIPPLQ